jgi:hypothetical protein
MALTSSHTSVLPVDPLTGLSLENGRATFDLHHPPRVTRSRSKTGRTETYHMRDNIWETTVRTAANTMLHYPDKISDGLEAELYALLEKLGTAEEDQPEGTGEPDDAA